MILLVKNSAKLIETSLLIAISFILGFIKIIHLPYGGSVTLCSLLPLFFISYKYGFKWGIFSGLAVGIIDMSMGALEGVFKGTNFTTVIFVILLDYIIAFCVLAFCALPKKKIKNKNVAFVSGIFIGSFFKYLVHITSGFIFFGSYANSFFSQPDFALGEYILTNFSPTLIYFLYSLIYNSMYMIPEILITMFVGYFVFKIDFINKKIS